jgi:hypothetical protein
MPLDEFVCNNWIGERRFVTHRKLR